MIALLADPAVFALAAGLLGLLVGSFLNVVIHRLPIMMERDWAAQCAELRGEAPPAFEPLSLARPRSRCPQCGHSITALENIPVISWLLLRGRCKGCAARDFLPLSADRSADRAAVRACRLAFWFHRSGPGCPGVYRGADRPDRHRFRYPVAARRHHPAAALGWGWR